MNGIERVCIFIKTFLRDGFLFETVEDLCGLFPEARLVIADDGEMTAAKERLYQTLRRRGHTVLELPFDSGFGAKSNAAIAHFDRPYVLVGSDDFDFKQARPGVERLVAVLDNVPEVGLASGRVRGKPYEGWLVDVAPGVMAERRIAYDQPRYADGVEYHLCDLTVNYSLIRASVLGPDKAHWDDDIKIGGGEHAAFFIEVRKTGAKVAYVPGVSITELPYQPGKVDRRYPALRARARQPGRPALKRRGVDTYVLFDGTAEAS